MARHHDQKHPSFPLVLSRQTRLWTLLLCLVGSATGCLKAGQSKLLPVLDPSAQRSRKGREILSLKWRRSIDPDYTYKYIKWSLSPEETAYPLVTDEAVYVGSEQQRLSCYDRKTGKIRWSVKVKGRIVSQPMLQGELIYVGTTSGFFYAFERQEGRKQWRYQASGEILAHAAFVAPSKAQKTPLIVFTTSNNQVYALTADKGKWQWHYKRESPAQLSIRGQAPPVVYKQNIYTGFSNGFIVSLNAADGVLRWQRSLLENDRFPDVDSPLVIHNDILYAASYSGSLHALKLKDGKTIWKNKLIGASSVKVIEDELYVTDNSGRVYCYDANQGKLRWKKRFKKAGALNAPAGNEQVLFLSTRNRGVYVLRRRDGRLLQVMRFGKGFSSPAVIYRRSLIAFSNNSFVYAFHIR